MPAFAAREGGAVLNAAIEPVVTGSARWDDTGLHLEYSLDAPGGSHLGTSASVDVAWLALTSGLIGNKPTPLELAETAYKLEALLGVEGGKQDQYAAAFGGFNLLRFGAEDQPARIERLDVSANVMRALGESLVLCFAGAPEGGADATHREVWKRYAQGDEGITRALRVMRDSVEPARDALLAGDLPALARVLTVNRAAARGLHSGVETGTMTELFEAARGAGALGAKGCGAGGGGCLLFLCADGRRGNVEEALRAHDGRVIPFSFAARSIWG